MILRLGCLHKMNIGKKGWLFLMKLSIWHHLAFQALQRLLVFLKQLTIGRSQMKFHDINDQTATKNK